MKDRHALFVIASIVMALLFITAFVVVVNKDEANVKYTIIEKSITGDTIAIYDNATNLSRISGRISFYCNEDKITIDPPHVIKRNK